MITTSTWVRRGVAAQFPAKYEIDEEEMNRISKLAREQLEDAREDLSAAQEGQGDDDEKMDEGGDAKGDAVQGGGEKKADAKESNEWVFLLLSLSSWCFTVLMII